MTLIASEHWQETELHTHNHTLSSDGQIWPKHKTHSHLFIFTLFCGMKQYSTAQGDGTYVNTLTRTNCCVLQTIFMALLWGSCAMPKAVMSNSIEILDRLLLTLCTHQSIVKQMGGIHKLGYNTYIRHRLYSCELWDRCKQKQTCVNQNNT